MLKAGDKAIEFTAKNHLDEDVSLKDYKGKKIVLYFYPKDNTPGCTTEACSFRDVYDDILDKGAVVIGVSKDSVASHQKFMNKYDLPFHLISDPEHKVIEAYGAWDEKNMYGKKYMGTTRMTYLIDENGIILNAWSKVKPAEHAKEILQALK